MPTTFNLFVSISWMITGIVSAFISSLVLSKNPKKRLNQVFSAGFICWSLSLLFNGLVFIVAYESLVAANVFRDFCIIFGIFAAIMLFLSAYALYFGADSLDSLIPLVIFGVVAIVLAVAGVLNDWVVMDAIEGVKTTDNWFGKTCTQIIPFTFIIAGDILLILTVRGLENPLAKRRVIFFITGFSVVIFGMLLFVVDSLIQNISPFILPTLALMCWVLGPMQILVGFYVKVEAKDLALSPTFSRKAIR